MEPADPLVYGSEEIILQPVPALHREVYLKAVQTHAEQTTLQTLYPGHGFEDLYSFLIRSPLASRHPVSYGQESPAFAMLYTVDNEIKPDVSSYDDSVALTRAMEHNVAASKPQLVFLKGFPSPEWLLDVGATFGIDPEFFKLHMRFRESKEYHSSPSLPSSLEHIVRLRISTVGSREEKRGVSHQINVDKLRSEASKSKHLYEHNLGVANDTKRGDSVVRGFYVLDEKHFVIEQEMSVCLSQIAGSWSVLILTDIGNDLSQGPSGPWLTKRDRESSSPWTRFYPVVQHRHKIALVPKASHSAKGGLFTGKCPQSASLLAEHYAEFADMQLFGEDPFYSLNELFRFVAHSENLFLATLEVKIDVDTRYASADQDQLTLSNLSYFHGILERHQARLRENIDVIKRRGHSCGPQVSNSDKTLQEKSHSAAESLLKDFEYLHVWAKSLSERCSQGTNVIMNNSMLAESKKAIEQAEGLRKLTLVAFFYIPLSFTTSFFGMNFKQLGQGDLSVWVWFIASGPVLIISICFLLWDYRGFYISSKELLRRFASVFY
ncbi:hypothetical protein JMJ35_006579 [Cladonia borealis]|uniref:Uncharacterized protein n=1 Tax=Cladonia borealis TaxID=184061 RepID=A0AA39QXF6_9LECA|nr:hypothetical protein JMJ35_006579 [Cladonia borealis]